MMSRNWRDLIRPKAIQLDPESNSELYGKFTCEPLERGFGITIGNSLRRVLLASLQGAAITAVRLDGALHEFTTIPDVVEDVTDIILNLKEVVFKAESPKTYTVRLEKEGPGPVLAGDIKVVDGLTVLNPDHHDRDARQEGPALDGAHGQRRPRLRPRRAQQDADHADRHDPDRRAVLADPQGELHRAERARRSGHRLRQARCSRCGRTARCARSTPWPSPPRS